MNFCDFCDCDDCKHGETHLSHAQTVDGRWICDVCFTYDLCTSGPERADEPCKDIHCRHRPKLATPWVFYANKSLTPPMVDDCPDAFGD